MTTPGAEYVEHILELLEPVGMLQASRFFGGVRLSTGFVQFAMMMGKSLYFVVDDDTQRKYEQAGMGPLSYQTKKGRIEMRRYFEVPEDVLSVAEQLRHWAREAMLVAEKTKKPNKTTKRISLS